jgi:hypothetical protein
MSQQIANLAAGAAQALANLPHTTFEIPERVRTATDPKTITIRQLLFEEEKAAMEAKEKGGGSFASEGAMRSVCEADGNPITWTDDQAVTFFRGLSNKVRDLVVQGFISIALPAKDEVADFLASAKTSG